MRKTSNTLKILKGTDQPVRMDVDHGIPSLLKLPPTPKILSRHGRKIYRKFGNTLLARNELNDHNIIGFTMFCAEFSIWYDNMLKFNNGENEMILTSFNKNGDEYKYLNPLYKIARDAGDRAMSLLKEFGFTTLSLTKVASLIRGNPNNDEYEKYLNS